MLTSAVCRFLQRFEKKEKKQVWLLQTETVLNKQNNDD